MNSHKYDIFMAQFPFTDLSIIKTRPVLILKNFEGNNILVCQITTKRHNLQKYEIILESKDCNQALRMNSFIYIDIITTLHKNKLVKKLGSVTNNLLFNEINDKLKLLLFD